MIKIPIYLSPLNSLGNRAFREVSLNSGADYVFTEMVKVEKLIEGVKYQYNKLIIPENQRNNTIVQIICDDIQNIPRGVELVMENNPYIKEINYNMGCPQASLCKDERGGAIIGNPDKVEEVAKLMKKSCDAFAVVASIKLRLGIKRDSINIKENTKRIHKSGINKVYIHGRCLKESYRTPATYSEIAEIKKDFPEMQIFANGDVKDSASLKKIVKETNCDGVLIGRSAVKDPYIFKKLISEDYIEDNEVNFSSRIDAMKEFLKYAILYDISLDRIKSNLNNMTVGVIGASEFRWKLNNMKTIPEVQLLIKN